MKPTISQTFAFCILYLCHTIGTWEFSLPLDNKENEEELLFFNERVHYYTEIFTHDDAPLLRREKLSKELYHAFCYDLFMYFSFVNTKRKTYCVLTNDNNIENVPFEGMPNT